MPHYSQPAAANYHTAPSGHTAKARGYRLCDQCGSVETPGVSKFRLCGGCMITQYCSEACQKVHWQSHKAICQHTVAQMKSQPSCGSHEDTAKNLRKFTSAHTSLLSWSGFQALQLKRSPAHIAQYALLIDMEPRSHPDSHRRFAIKQTRIVPRTYITDPLVISDIQRREQRSRQTGGIGALVVLIQCNGVSQVLPVETDHPSRVSWDERADWEPTLRHFVDSGRMDFKPISTGSRGVHYG